MQRGNPSPTYHQANRNAAFESIPACSGCVGPLETTPYGPLCLVGYGIEFRFDLDRGKQCGGAD